MNHLKSLGKILICFSILFTGINAAFANTGGKWVHFTTHMPNDGGNCTSIAINKNGTPYVAYNDSEHQNNASVIYFHKENGWQYVGRPGFSKGGPWPSPWYCEGFPTIAFDHQQTLYAVFYEGSGWDFSVMKYSNGDWQYVGKPKFATGSLSGLTTHIAFDSKNVPYVVSHLDHKISVMKYENDNWVPVGSINPSSIGSTSIAIDKYDVPYVAYVDISGRHRIVVQKYTVNKGWESIGESDLTEIVNDYNNIYIAIDQNQVPYIAYPVLDDINHHGIGMVKKFIFGRWVTVGSLPMPMYGMRIAIDSHNRPFISFQDGYRESKASVMKLENEGWVFVGPREFSEGKWPSGLSFALDGNDVPYVAYGVINYPAYGITAMKFEKVEPIKVN